MKKSGIRLLLLVALLFSLPVIAYSDCLYNGSFDLNLIENKIVVEGEVALVQSEIVAVDIVSVAPIPYEASSILVSWNLFIIIDNRKRKLYGIKRTVHIRSPDDLLKVA